MTGTLVTFPGRPAGPIASPILPAWIGIMRACVSSDLRDETR